MGVVGAAIKFIAIPIALVVLLAFVAFVVISKRKKKQRQKKDLEQAETFTEFRLPQAPPPTYNKLPPQTTTMPIPGNHQAA